MQLLSGQQCGEPRQQQQQPRQQKQRWQQKRQRERQQQQRAPTCSAQPVGPARAGGTASKSCGNKLPLLALLVCLLGVLLLVSSCLAGPTSSHVTGQAGATLVAPRESKGIFKRSFAGLGCLGVYDKAKFARLDRVCEECYTLYREPDIHTACRQDCFRNNVFTRCVDALLLSHEAKKFDEMVDELYGK